MSEEARSREAAGVFYGLGAYAIWGFAPVYWKVLRALDPAEVLAHRVVWSFVVGMLLLAGTRRFAAYRATLVDWRHAVPVGIAAVLLAINWLVFIYAVATERVLATSLGYYLNPLLNVVLGLAVLGERLRPLQWIAVGLASFGVGQYVWGLGELPWISVVLAGTFGLYGLVRKMGQVEPIPGFGVETTLLCLPALAYIGWLASQGRSALPVGSLGMDAFIAASGLLTAAPLVLFNAAARRLPLITVGILQFLAPSIALVLAVVVYDEPFERVHAWTFGFVWAGLVVFTAESWLANRRLMTFRPSP
jgi:chloramphenicol-sensitive protein RarD